MGDRRFVDTDSQIKYSRFNAVINIRRNIVSFSIKELLPLMFFIYAGNYTAAQADAVKAAELYLAKGNKKQHQEMMAYANQVPYPY